MLTTVIKIFLRDLTWAVKRKYIRGTEELNKMEQTLNHKIFLIKITLQESFVAGNSKAKKKENKTTQGCASRRHAEWYWHFFYATCERVSPLFSALREAFRWDVLGGSRQRLGAWLP